MALAAPPYMPAQLIGRKHGLSPSQESEVQRELAEESRKRQKVEDKWVYRSREELERTDPSLLDGLDPVKLKLWRRQIAKIQTTAAIQLKLPQWAIAASAMLCYRFYSRKSMKRNDRFIIATACLHLAAKMEESPKHVTDVVRECRKVFAGGKKTGAEQRKNEAEEVEKFKEEVLAAERAVLYTLEFDLNYINPYRHLVTFSSQLGLLNMAQQNVHEPFRNYMQNTWNFTNDSFRTTLCLQYPPAKVAGTALWLANVISMRLHGAEGDVAALARRVLGQPDADFFQIFQVTKEEVEDIAQQILALYEDVKQPFPAAIGSQPAYLS